MPPAGGGNAHVRHFAFQPATVAPEKTTAQTTSTSTVLSWERTGRRKGHLLDLGSGRAPFLPLGSCELLGAASAPSAAELPQPLTARREHLGPGVPAPGEGRGGASARGAGRARAGARGGSARAEPSGAEPSWEVLGRGRLSPPAACGSARIVLRRRSPRTPASAQAPAKLLFSGASRAV